MIRRMAGCAHALRKSQLSSGLSQDQNHQQVEASQWEH